MFIDDCFDALTRRHRDPRIRREPVTLLTLASVGASIGGSMYASKQASKKPKLEPTPLMPDPSDPSALAARRREEERTRATKGRASTVLSDDYDPAASTSYSNDLLGA